MRDLTQTPLAPGSTRTVTVNRRESPLAWLLARFSAASSAPPPAPPNARSKADGV